MPNYTDAPWNAPVENEGRELSDSDIPTRRRKPGEKKEDVLTELIFGAYGEPQKNEPSHTPEPEPKRKPTPVARAVSAPQTHAQKEDVRAPKKETTHEKRARLLKELEDLEKKEKEISSALRTFEKPEKKVSFTVPTAKTATSVSAPLRGAKKGGRQRVTSSSFKNARSAIFSPLAPVDGVRKEPTKALSSAMPIVVPVRTPEKKAASQPALPQRMDGVLGGPKQKGVHGTRSEIQKTAGNQAVEPAVPTPVHSPDPAPEITITTPEPEKQDIEKDVEREPIPAVAPVLPTLEQPVPVTASAAAHQAEQKIYEYYTKDHDHPKKRSFSKQLVVVGCAFVVVAGILGLIDGNKLPTSFAFLSNISGFLRQESFALTEENKQSFPQLVEVYESVMEARAQFTGSKELEELAESLETFFSSNESFLWRDYFNGRGTELKEVGELDNVIKQKKLFEAAHDHVLFIHSDTLTERLRWIAFLGELFKDDALYLVLTTNSSHPTPAGGEPLYYSVLDVSQGGAKVTSSGLAQDLNAALTTKIIPPRAVQGVKTDLDLMEAGWLYSFTDAAQLMTLMYEQTTQERIDGVLLVTDSSARSIMGSAGVSGELSQSWVGDVLSTLGSQADFTTVSARLKEEFDRGSLQAAFEQNTFATYAKGKLNQSAEADTMDGLTASLRVWEGEGAHISLLEYTPRFNADGSVVGNASATVKNDGAKQLRAYLKFYIPKQSMLLDAQGYSQKVLPPAFDYSANGFAQHALIEGLNERASEEFVALDVFEEGDFSVIGGWVVLPAGAEHTATLSYRIPSRLDWRAGNARYDFTVLPISAGRDVPFRFVAQREEGVRYEWKEPLSHVAQPNAEFQKALASRVKLSATISFTEQASNTEAQ